MGLAGWVRKTRAGPEARIGLIIEECGDSVENDWGDVGGYQIIGGWKIQALKV